MWQTLERLWQLHQERLGCHRYVMNHSRKVLNLHLPMHRLWFLFRLDRQMFVFAVRFFWELSHRGLQKSQRLFGKLLSRFWPVSRSTLFWHRRLFGRLLQRLRPVLRLSLWLSRRVPRSLWQMLVTQITNLHLTYLGIPTNTK